MGGEAVLGDTGVGSRSEEVVLETRLNHPPTNDALKADERGDTSNVEGHGEGDTAAGNKVEGGQDEGYADDTAPDAVGPFHEIDLLKLGEGHVRVEKLELGGCSVLVEFGGPGFVVGRKDSSRDGTPFGDTQALEGILTLANVPHSEGMERLVMPRDPPTKDSAYPDSVRRVNPPKMTMPNTLTAEPRSQRPTALEVVNSGLLLFVVVVASAAVVLSEAARSCSETVAVVVLKRTCWAGKARACRTASRTRERVAVAGAR